MRQTFAFFSVSLLAVYSAQCTGLRNHQEIVSMTSQESKAAFDESHEEGKADDAKTDEEDERETEEMDFSLATKNLESEISHREQIQAQDRKAEHDAEDAVKKIEAKPPACSVQKTGKLLLASDPMDVLSVGEYAATITKRHFTVHYPDHPEAPFMKFPIIEIKTPIETLRRSRRCFRLFHKDTPKLFCTESHAERNDWIKDIYKAIFCINTGVQVPEGQEAEAATEKGKQVSLPASSTKVQRWTEQQAKQTEKIAQEAEKGDIDAKGGEKGVPEIEITAGQYGQAPKVTVNGENIAVPTIAENKHNMNEGATEG